METNLLKMVNGEPVIDLEMVRSSVSLRHKFFKGSRPDIFKEIMEVAEKQLESANTAIKDRDFYKFKLTDSHFIVDDYFGNRIADIRLSGIAMLRKNISSSKIASISRLFITLGNYDSEYAEEGASAIIRRYQTFIKTNRYNYITDAQKVLRNILKYTDIYEHQGGATDEELYEAFKVGFLKNKSYAINDPFHAPQHLYDYRWQCNIGNIFEHPKYGECEITAHKLLKQGWVLEFRIVTTKRYFKKDLVEAKKLLVGGQWVVTKPIVEMEGYDVRPYYRGQYVYSKNYDYHQCII